MRRSNTLFTDHPIESMYDVASEANNDTSLLSAIRKKLSPGIHRTLLHKTTVAEWTPICMSELEARLFGKTSNILPVQATKMIPNSSQQETKHIFGNCLANMPLCCNTSDTIADHAQSITDSWDGLPEFIVLCVEKIEMMISTVGVYRINGSAEVIQELRLVPTIC